MITPQELKDRMAESEFIKDMENALKEVDREIKVALNKGDIRILVPTHIKLGNLFYSDEKQKALAEKLLSMGYNCKKESEVIDGVRQSPTWFLYFQ